MRSMIIAVGCIFASLAIRAEPAKMSVAGEWQVKIVTDNASAVLNIEPAEQISVTSEKIKALPLYNPKAAQYARGRKLAGIRAKECTVRFAMDPDSLVVRTAQGNKPLVRGKDYEAELTWGCIGRLEGGAIASATPVVASYRYGKMRLDSAVLTSSGKIELRKGVGHVSIPVPPALTTGERRLGNIWVTASLKKLDDVSLFPVLEQKYPESRGSALSTAEKLLPKTMAKLKANGKVRILAWGDSVTDGGYLPDPKKNRWQQQFIRRLRARYPKAEIVLISEAWGGRSTGSYFNEPPGSKHNYREKVLALKPDLIVSEFVNDAGLNEASVYQRYGRIRDDFKAIGAEWIILTPHYVRPDKMGLKAQKNIDEDPRAYVKAIRKFSAENNIALAEGSLRYGRLWRQGIPYLTLLMNNINHPDPYGMGLFADALMQLFP